MPVLKKQRNSPRNSGRHVSPIQRGAKVNMMPMATPMPVSLMPHPRPTGHTIDCPSGQVYRPCCSKLLQHDTGRRNQRRCEYLWLPPVRLQQGDEYQHRQNLSCWRTGAPSGENMCWYKVGAIRLFDTKFFLKRRESSQLTTSDDIEALHNDAGTDPKALNRR